MSMFQPQNYGADFIGGMTAMSNMVNDRRRLDMDEKRQAEDAKTRSLQQEGLTLENQQKSQALETEKRLQAFLTHARDWDNGQITKEGLATLNKVTPELVKETPYVSDRIEDFPARRQANNVLAKGVESISTLPPGNYIYTRADNLPEINQTLDAYQMNLPPERFNKEFVDKDGTVTGKPGTVYKTTGVGGFAMMSGDGRDAAFTPMFSVADAQGNPIVKPDGKPLLVPATVNGSNDPNDPVRKIRPEEILTKIGFANKLMDTAEKLVGTADKRKEYVAQTLPYYMGEKGAEAVLKANQKDKTLHAFAVDQDVYDGDGKLIRAAAPKEKYITVPEGATVYNTADNSVVATGTPKTKAPTTRTIHKDGFAIDQEYVNGSWSEVGRKKDKEPADPAVAENKRAERESKTAIDKTIDEINKAKSRLAALRKDGKTAGDAEYDEAAQEVVNAKTAYKNRASEHEKSYGRSYNPLKEVVEYTPGRDISPLKTAFEEKDGVFVKRDFPSFIAKARSAGWTPDEIKRAAKGTDGESAVNEYYAQQSAPRQAAAPKQQAKPQQAKTQPKRQQTAKNDTRPPLSAFNKGR